MNPCTKLKLSLSLAFCFFGGLLPATSFADDIVVYKMTQSARYKVYDAPVGDAIAVDARSFSDRYRFYFIYHRPTETFRYLYYSTNRTPNGVERIYEPSVNEIELAAALVTNYEGSRNELVLSIHGSGNGKNYSENGGVIQAEVETLVGRIRKHKVRTRLGFRIEMHVPSVIRGEKHTESMTEAVDGEDRMTGATKTSMRLAKKLTGECVGLTHAQAQFVVENYLQEKGYVRAD